MSAGLVAAIVVLNLAASIWLLGHTIIRTERSRFRRTLWGIRDSLVKAILDEKVRPARPIIFEIRQLETLIAGTEILTPFRYVAAAKAVSKKAARLERPSLEELTPAENAVLREARAEASKALVRMVVIGSPSGWLLGAVAPVAGPLLARLDNRRSPVVEEPVLPGFDDRAADPESSVEEVAGWSALHLGSPTDVVRPFTAGSNHLHAIG